jgi:hypothetical protein
MPPIVNMGSGGSMSIRKQILTFVLCAGVAFTLPLAGAAAAKTKDGCKAITTAQVNAAFADIAGGEAPDGTPTKYKGYTSCSWTFPGGAIVFIGLDKVSKVSKQDFKERSKASDVEKVPGLKKSFFAPVEQSGTGGTITFIDGTTFVNLQYFTTGAAGDINDVKDALTGLAKKAAKKL